MCAPRQRVTGVSWPEYSSWILKATEPSLALGVTRHFGIKEIANSVGE